MDLQLDQFLFILRIVLVALGIHLVTRPAAVASVKSNWSPS